MSRLFWIVVGAGVAVALMLRGRELLHRLTPRGVQEQVAQRGHVAAANLGDFVGTFRSSMAQREEELRRELNIPATTH